MKVFLYLNSAENERVDKTPYLQEVASLSGFLRAPTNLLSPSITFELSATNPSPLIDEDGEEVSTPDDDIVCDGEDILQFNYAYIPEFNRYYYVNEIQLIRTGFYLVRLSCDVLMSFKDSILSLRASVARNEFDYNPLINDDAIPFESGEIVNFSKPSNIADNPITFDANIDDTKKHWVLNTMSDLLYFYTNEVTPPNDLNLPTIKTRSFYIPFSSVTYALASSEISFVSNAVKSDDTIASFVKSVIAFPFEVPHQEEVRDFFVGNHRIKNFGNQDASAHLTISALAPYLELCRFKFPTASSFDELPPFREYELYVPFVGYVPLDAKRCAGRTISVYYAPNYEDGSAMCNIVAIEDGAQTIPIYSTTCQLGVKCSFTSTNNRENTDQRNASALNTAIGILSGAVNTGIGIANANPITIAGGITSISKATASAINTNAMMHTRGQVSLNGGTQSLYSPLDWHLKITLKKRALSDLDAYRHQYGSPLLESRLLSSLSGFTTIQAIHLENLSAFKDEKEEIERLLMAGVIL